MHIQGQTDLFDSIVSLPLYPLLSEKEVDYIIYTIKKLFATFFKIIINNFKILKT